jgi:hypothetical protein
MSLPGFGAENSVRQASWSYFGARTLGPVVDDVVSPQFLGVIREAFQSAGRGLSLGTASLAASLGGMISNAGKGGGPDNSKPFACRTWAGGVLACRNGQPLYSQAEMMSRCVSSNPTWSPLCISATAGLYPLVKRACSEDSNSTGNLLGAVCQD